LVSTCVVASLLFVATTEYFRRLKPVIANDDDDNDDAIEESESELVNSVVKRPLRNKIPIPIHSSLKMLKIGRHDLVRKMIADPNYKLDVRKNEDADLRKSLEETMKRALWDAITVDIVQNKDFSKVLVLIDELRQKINLLTPHRRDLHEELNDVLDVKHLKMLLEKEIVDDKWLDRIVETVVKSRILLLQAPIRNQKTCEWLVKYKSRDFGAEAPSGPERLLLKFRTFLDFAHEKLEEIQLDTTNHHLQSLSILVREKGVEYYRKVFEEDMQSGNIGLDIMQKWFVNLKKRYDYPNDVSDLRTLHHIGTLDTIWKVYEEESREMAITNLPETFLSELDMVMDLFRISRGICRTASCLLIIRQILESRKLDLEQLGSQIHSLLLSETKQTKTVVQGNQLIVSFIGDQTGALNVSIATDLVINCTKQILADNGHSLEKQEEDFVRTALLEAMKGSKNHKVYSLVSERLYSDLKSLMMINDKETKLHCEKMHLSSLLKEQLIQLSKKLIEFADRDFLLHSHHYLNVK